MMPANPERMIAHVEGRVQGVGFRAFVHSRALEIGVLGSVRNCPDGRVQVEAEGSRESLERLLRELHVGPPAARVEKVVVEWTKPRGLSRFTIGPM